MPRGWQPAASDSGSYRLLIVTPRIRVHTKILTTPNVAIETLIHNMREVYATATSTSNGRQGDSLPSPLNILDVGDCIMGHHDCGAESAV